MTPEVKQALEGVVGRTITVQEVTAIDALLPQRNDVAIAAILSVGRTRLQSKYIGSGTIMAVIGEHGGEFLDALQSLGATNRNVFWAMALITQGRLDIGEAATQAQVTALKAMLPDYVAGLDAILALGQVPDPIHYNVVSDALNIAEGRLTL